MNLKFTLLATFYADLKPSRQGAACLIASALLCAIALALPSAIAALKYPTLFAAGFIAGHGWSLLDKSSRTKADQGF
jgi:hypothetical protein